MSEEDEQAIPDMSLKDLTDGENKRGLPIVKFVEDIGAFAESFQPPASAELLIGAFTELHGKYKASEVSLQSKRTYIEVLCCAELAIWVAHFGIFVRVVVALQYLLLLLLIPPPTDILLTVSQKST